MDVHESWDLSNRSIIDKINKFTKNDRNIAIKNATETELTKIIKALKGSKYSINKLIYSIDPDLVEKFFNKINNKDIHSYIKHLQSDKKLFAYVLNSVSKKEQTRLVNKVQTVTAKAYWDNYLIESNKQLDTNNYQSTEEIHSQKIDQKTEYIRQLDNEVSNKENILKQLVIQKEEHLNLLENNIINLQSRVIDKEKEIQALNIKLENEKNQFNNDILNLKNTNEDLLEKEKYNFESKKESFTKEINKLENSKTRKQLYLMI